jgi:hypothetical protein
MSNTDNFTTQLCNNLGCTPFPDTYDFINTWASYEDTSAENNPLASEWKDGSTNFNPAGVQNYPSIAIGAQATAADLKAWPSYASIIAAIRSGGPFNTTDVVSGINYWGTSGFATFLLLGGRCTNSFTSPGISNTPPTPTPTPIPIPIPTPSPQPIQEDIVNPTILLVDNTATGAIGGYWVLYPTGLLYQLASTPDIEAYTASNLNYTQLSISSAQLANIKAAANLSAH